MEEKLKQVFAKALNIPVEKVTDDLAYPSPPEWDSISHMVLIGDIEEAFGVSFTTDEVIEASSFKLIKFILKEHGL